MNRKSLSLFSLAVGSIVAAASLTGCGNRSSGYVPQKPEDKPKVDLATIDRASLFPLKEGNEWTFESSVMARSPQGQTQTQPNEDVTLRVISVRDENGEKRAEIEVIRINAQTNQEITLENNDGQGRDRSGWMTNSEGVFQTAAGRQMTNYVPPLPALLFNVAEGDRQNFEGNGPRPDGSIGFYVGVYRTLGAQVADTLMGTFQAYVAEAYLYYTPEGTTPVRPGIPDGEAQLSNEPGLPEEPNTATTEEPSASPSSGDESAPMGEGETLNPGPEVPANQSVALTQMYFVPGTGLVRFRQMIRQPNGVIIEQILRLKDYKVN
ncbi:MAG: hypothetical protein KF812_08890 [Fimbriimonadaceae bacterium]|nr:hypothetical protein [Fimbriimonadaceae bacterium]